MTELAHIQFGIPLTLTQLREKYGLTRFVETGCFMGNGIQAAINSGFKHIWSCDISKRWVDHCKEAFPGVQVLEGRSVDVLHDILQRIGTEPTLFFLDAHFPHVHAKEREYGKEEIFPLMSEIHLVLGLRNCKKDVFVIDDLVFFDQPERVIREDLRVKGLSIDMLKDAFVNTHDTHILNQGEGVMLCLPR